MLTLIEKLKNSTKAYPFAMIDAKSEDKKDDDDDNLELHEKIIYVQQDDSNEGDLKNSFLLSLLSEPHSLSLAEARRVIKNTAESDYQPCTVFARKGIKLRFIPEMRARNSHRIYSFAPPNSGKSYWIGKYLEQFNHHLPENKIMLFSLKPEDDAFTNIKNLTRINLEKCESTCLDHTGFPEDSIIIADDCLNIPNDTIKTNVLKMMNSVCNVGRSTGRSCIITSHKGKNAKPVDVIINSASHYVLFPRGRRGQNETFMHDKIGIFDKKSKDVERLLDTAKERKAWNLLISVDNPQIAMMDDYIEILN